MVLEETTEEVTKLSPADGKPIELGFYWLAYCDSVVMTIACKTLHLLKESLALMALCCLSVKVICVRRFQSPLASSSASSFSESDMPVLVCKEVVLSSITVLLKIGCTKLNMSTVLYHCVYNNTVNSGES